MTEAEPELTEKRRRAKRRLAALLEVVLVLSGTLWLVGLVANSTAAARQWAVLGRPFLEYLTLMAVPLAVLTLTRRDLAENGLSAVGLRRNLHGAFVCMVPYAAAHAMPSLIAGSAVLVTAVSAALALGALVISARLLPSSAPGPLLLCALVPAFLLGQGVLAGAMSAAVFYVVFLGLGEEVLFRGYIQSTLNRAHGRPWCYRGVRFGWGLPVAALLFGAFHVLNLPQLYAGELQLAWSVGAVAVIWGLFFGYLREWGGSVVAPALVHGVPQAIAVAMGW